MSRQHFFFLFSKDASVQGNTTVLILPVQAVYWWLLCIACLVLKGSFKICPNIILLVGSTTTAGFSLQSQPVPVRK